MSRRPAKLVLPFKYCLLTGLRPQGRDEVIGEANVHPLPLQPSPTRSEARSHQVKIHSVPFNRGKWHDHSGVD
jgi:hypothetical protein